MILLKQSTSPCNLSPDDEFDSTTPLVSHLSSRRRKRIFDEIDEEDECEPGINNFDEPEITVGDSLSVSSSSVSACSSKKKVVKTEDDSIPLPDPFPLPKRYRAEVENALKEGCINKKIRSYFLSSVAASMLTYKKYPQKMIMLVLHVQW